jgi:cytochrome c-type biogenesis protein
MAMVFHSAKARIESMSWTKRMISALTVLFVLGIIVALIFAPSSTEEESVDSTSVAESVNLLALAFLSFFAGVLSFLSPCTLPILPAYFAFTFQSDRRRIAAMTLAFFLGLALVFSLLGASASALGSLLYDHQEELIRASGVLLIVFGLMSVLGRGFTGPNFQADRSATLGGSFVFGATFALGLSPCIGPILGGVYALATDSQSVTQGMLLLFIYAVGLGLPLLLVSTFIGDRPRDSLVWRILRGRGWHVNVVGRPLHLHSTGIVSGVLFLALGLVMIQGKNFQSLLPGGVVTWLTQVQGSLDGLQEKLLGVFR